jgi:hypothetical protein
VFEEKYQPSLFEAPVKDGIDLDEIVEDVNRNSLGAKKLQ